MAKSYPHVSKARRYARDVFNGRKVANKYEQLACERFLNDLERKDLVFDKDKAERACRFIEKFPHVKGQWARRRELIVLSGWQCFIVVNIFGFFFKDSGIRRFTEAYVRVARKNGKSTLAAGIGLYMFVEDDEYASEVYAGATTEKQAWEVFRPARKMAMNCPEFAESYGMEINAKNMNVVGDDSRFEPLIGDPGDGSSPHCVIIDEYHEHKSPNMYETMVTGMGAREQPLCLIITTSGTDITSPCFEKDNDCKKLLEGNFKDDSIFAMIYAADADDDWRSMTAMKKANPNLNVSVAQSYLKRRLAKARRSPSDQAAYKTKHLNIWVGSGATFLNPLDWELCGKPGLDIEKFRGMDCIFAVDLASRIDFVALSRLFFEQLDDENLRYWVFTKFWLPENRVDEDESGQLKRWAEDGWLTLHSDDEIDFAELRREIMAEAEKYEPHEIAYDPWRAMGLEQELTNEGYTMVKIPQTIAQFTTPMDELQGAHLTRRIIHDANPIMQWMAGNLVAKEDTNGNKKPRREIAKNKIDGMVALLMGINRAIAFDDGGYVTGELQLI